MKFSKKAFPPSFFDLSQDISKDLPLDVIAAWTASDQSNETALKILEKTKVKGTIVSSDSAGLSKMSQNLGLIEVLAKINRPKELVHKYGTAIGGEAVGIWAADNTQMFYKDIVTPQHIPSMLLALQEQIKKECDVQIGLGVHYGEFYSLGGGLYGIEAEWIEDIAENRTSGTEIVLSEHFLNLLPESHGFVSEERKDIEDEFSKVFKLISGQKEFVVGNEKGTEEYPVPYSDDFYADLKKYQKEHDDMHLDVMYKKYSKEAAVVLIEREKEDTNIHEISLLNNLALSVVMKKTAKEFLNKDHGWEVKTAGALGIYLFKDCKEAVAFAQKFRQSLQEDGIQCRIGIDCGTVLEFDLGDGHRDIAGMPVNRASKMAQDKGEMGHIYLSDTAGDEVDTTQFKPITFQVSGVSIEGFVG